MELKQLEETLGRIGQGVDGIVKKQGEESKKFEDFRTSIESRIQVVEERTKVRTAVATPAGARELHMGEEAKKFRFSRMIAMIATKDWNNPDYGFERECMVQYAKKQNRDLSTNIDSAGGYLVPPEVMTELIELLRAKLIVEALGARVISDVKGSPLIIPRQTGGATGYWVGENASITASQQTVGQLSLIPHQAAAMTKLSNLLVQLSNPDAEAMVREDIAAVLARTIDIAVFEGTGGANQPKGLCLNADINSTSIGASPDIDDLFEMLLKIETANADQGKIGWAMHPRTWNTLRKLKDAEGRYYLAPDVSQGIVKGTLLGYPYRTTTQFSTTLGAGAASRLIVGNFNDLILAMWGQTSIMASMEAGDSFEKNETWVRIVQQCDVGVRHGKSFCQDETILA